MMNAKATPKYLAVIQDVHEVSLFGSMDIKFWQAYFSKEKLSPYSENGQAELLINAVELKWMGIQFRELVLSVLVSEQEDGNTMDGYYLVKAYNSSRMLTFSERVFFQTPYVQGEVGINIETPATIKQGKAFHAEMSGKALKSGDRDEVFEGKIFIQNNRYFYAMTCGVVERYPFLREEDTLEIEVVEADDTFQLLAESGFVSREWGIRRNGVHARSKTYWRA